MLTIPDLTGLSAIIVRLLSDWGREGEMNFFWKSYKREVSFYLIVKLCQVQFWIQFNSSQYLKEEKALKWASKKWTLDATEMKTAGKSDKNVIL